MFSFIGFLKTYGQHNGNTGQSKTLSSISLNLATVNPSCGYNNGSILVTVSGGTPPYIYLLNGNKQNNGYFPALNADGNFVYIVTVTDANGQAASARAILTNTLPPPGLTVTATVLPSTCTSADGKITLSGTGGVPPYQYSMDGVNYSSNNIFTNLTQGEYFFFVQDANGCIAKSGIGFLPGQFDPVNSCGLHGNGEGSGLACKIDGSLDIAAGGGTPPYQYSIDGVNYFQSPYPSVSDYFNNLPSGLYHLYVKDATGTISVSGYQIIQYCGVSISYVIVAAACHQSNGSVTISVANGTAPYMYTMDGINYQNGNVFTGLSIGTYSFSVKDATGGIYSLQANVYDRCPVVAVVAKDDTCGQNKGSLIATGSMGAQPYRFSVDGINFQSNPVFKGLPAGSYTVTIKDANGFTSTAGAIIVNNCLKLSLSLAGTTCGRNNGSISVTVFNGTLPYLVSLDGVNFQAGGQFSGLAPGSYTVTAKDAAGLTAISDAIIFSTPAPQISVVTTQASCNNTGGSIDINVSGGTPPFLYSIDNGTTLVMGSTFKNLDSANYIAYIQDANACAVVDTVQLTALSSPKFSLGNDTTLCEGQTLLLAAPVSASYQYQWQDNSKAGSFRVTRQGIYSLKITNQYGCSSMDTVVVRYSPLPVFSIGADTIICNGKTVLLAPSPTLQQGSYLWSTGSTGPSLIVDKAGTYWLRITENGCANQEAISISYKPTPAVALGSDTTLCEGQTLLLSAANNNSTYLWTDGSTGPTFTVSGAGAFSVAVTENGCSATGQVTVTYLEKPILNLIKDTALCITQQLILNAAYPNSSYKWQDGSILPLYTVTKSGIYSVQVTDVCGTTKDTTIVSFENCGCNFYVPNAFTPNSDGKNDVFIPKYQCLFSDFQLKVFNRWGQMIFVSGNASIGWDGKFGSQLQPTGVYVWMLSYKDNLTGKYVHKNGTVILIR